MSFRQWLKVTYPRVCLSTLEEAWVEAWERDPRATAWPTEEHGLGKTFMANLVREYWHATIKSKGDR